MTEPVDPRRGCVVRIRQGSTRKAAGVGVLVGEREIVTCAHVVNTALGRPQRTQDKPTGGLLIDFPQLDGSPLREATVEAWRPPPQNGTFGGDIAGLRIIGEPLPTTACPARLDGRVPPVDVTVFGFPTDPPRPHGGWSSATLIGTVGGGMLQLDKSNEAALRAQPGYSGSPVFGPDSIVLGLLSVAARDDDVKDAYAIPVRRLAEVWPDVCRVVPPSPYRGLSAFREQDADLFVGRGGEAERLAARVRVDTLVCLTGPSGVGKTSLVQAGLIPLLRNQRSWTVASFRPGTRPLDALAAALLRAESNDPSREPPVDQIRTRSAHLRAEDLWESLEELAAARGTSVLLIADPFEECLPVIADQFEECLTDDTENQARELIKMILQDPPSPTIPARILISLRADFVNSLLSHRSVTASLNDRMFPLQVMTSIQLQQAIIEPAKRREVNYAEGLVKRILQDAGSDQGTLPLVEFTVSQLWDLQYAGMLRHEEYTRIGGVTGALGTHAERIAADLLADGVSEEVLHRALLSLVRTGLDHGPATRRIARQGDIGADWNVLDRLAKGRLVTLDKDNDDVPTAELTHEALIGGWERLARLVAENADFVRWRTRMEELYQRDDPIPENRIAEAESWTERRPSDIPSHIRYLVDKSTKDHAQRIANLQALVNRSEALRLAAQADLVLSTRTVPRAVSALLAAESLTRAPTLEGDLAARHAMKIAPRLAGRLDHDDRMRAVAFSPDGHWVATASADSS
uniref:nSTAND1 domain-containing NTPase n=1 Tax=unclassified Frankia TaxID=2632575 RepID=UPI002AD3BA3D